MLKHKYNTCKKKLSTKFTVINLNRYGVQFSVYLKPKFLKRKNSINDLYDILWLELIYFYLL